MTTVIIGIGVPGSGKTELLKALAGENPQDVYVCPDEIRVDLAGSAADQTKNPQVWAEAYRMIIDALLDDRNVIIDATNAKGSDRRQLVELCSSLASEVVGVWFKTPLEECLRRNQGRDRQLPKIAIQRMFKTLESDPPTKAEGFDSLQIVYP